MFSSAHEPLRSRAADVRRSKTAHELRLLAEGARVDDRVQRVGVDVQHGPENHVDSNSPRLAAKHLAELESEIGGAGRTDGHHGREDGAASLSEQGWERVDVAIRMPGPFS